MEVEMIVQAILQIVGGITALWTIFQEWRHKKNHGTHKPKNE